MDEAWYIFGALSLAEIAFILITWWIVRRTVKKRINKDKKKAAEKRP